MAASGWFVGGDFGVLLTPLRFLQVGAQLHLTTSIDASGKGSATYNPYAVNPRDQIHSEDVVVTSMRVPMTHQLRVGVRLVLPRRGQVRLNDPRPPRGYDPMRDEVADLEVTGLYERAASFQDLGLQFGGNISLGAGTAPVSLPPVALPHQWRDVWGLRVGGDVNVLPGRLALRAGVSYETGAYNPRYMNFDVPATQTLGLHVGATVRIGRHVSASLAYAHHFIGTVDNTAAIQGTYDPMQPDRTGLHTIGTTGFVAADQCTISRVGPGACDNNRGVYTSSMDVLSAGVNLAF
jgi:long-chain fatty acid transport protein